MLAGATALNYVKAACLQLACTAPVALALGPCERSHWLQADQNVHPRHCAG